MSRGSLSHTGLTGTNVSKSIALVVGIGHFPPNFCGQNRGFWEQTRVAARARGRSPIANENQRFGRIAARRWEGSLRKSAQHYAKSFRSPARRSYDPPACIPIASDMDLHHRPVRLAFCIRGKTSFHDEALPSQSRKFSCSRENVFTNGCPNLDLAYDANDYRRAPLFFEQVDWME